MRLYRLALASAFLALIVVGSGCSMKNLRRNFNDQQMAQRGPTVGGVWSERGLLSDDDPVASAAMGLNRGPASAAAPGGANYSYTSWASPEATREGYSQNYIEQSQPEVAFSNTPNLEPPTRRQYKNGARATRDDFIDNEIDSASLWASDGQTNYYFTKNKVRSQGDIVTITIQTDLYRDAITEVTRTLTPYEQQVELAEAQERIRKRYLGIAQPGQTTGQQGTEGVAASASAAERAPAATGNGDEEKKIDEDDIPEATFSDIDVTSQLELKEGDTIMAEIVHRYPNGNYKIRGTKRLRYRNGVRFMNVLAVVRGSDISEQGMIESGKLYEYRLEVVR